MREIKFKAQRVSDGEWVEGSLIQRIESTEIHDSVFTWVVDSNTICQFTGLHDRNGEEIYEGDIVKYPNDNRECEVIYRANDYGAGFLTDSHDGIHSLGDVMNTLEVIGNIHDK